MSGLRRGTKDVVDILLRNSGHPRSKPMELPLLGHRARSCRSRPCAAIKRARLLTRLYPRCTSPSETPGSPVTSKAPTLERFSSPSCGPPTRGTCPYPPAAPARIPRTRHPSLGVPSGVKRASARRETRRGAVPMLLAPQRPSPVARLSPGFIRRHRRTRRVRRLTLTESYRGVYYPPERRSNRPMRCHASPASRPRILSVTARMGRLSRHYSSSSTATLPHAGALRHEPVMRPIAPEHRTTHGVAAPVTNFGAAKLVTGAAPAAARPHPPPHPGGAAARTETHQRADDDCPRTRNDISRSRRVERAQQALLPRHPRPPNRATVIAAEPIPSPAPDVPLPTVSRVPHPTPPGSDPAPQAGSTSSATHRRGRHRAPPLPPEPSP